MTVRPPAARDLPKSMTGVDGTMTPIEGCACGAWLLRLPEGAVWTTPTPPDHEHAVVDEGGGAL